MHILITALAAICATMIWKFLPKTRKYRLGTLCLIYWGAAIMWLVDEIIAFIQNGAPFIKYSFNSVLLGIAVVVLALIIWAIILLIYKPKKV